MSDDARSEMLKLNEQQAKFYNTANAQRQFNPIMKAWRTVRRRMYFLMDNVQIRKDILGLHKEWIGDLGGKKVLDFGCYEGNALSEYLARHSGSYLGVDLSEKAVLSLKSNLNRKGLTRARVQAVDILSPDFREEGFDLIYAQGVLHHFKPMEPMLAILHAKLAPGGMIVSQDPLQTSLLSKSVRSVYHPFRLDREWEWPFNRETFSTLKKYFEIKHVRGVMGASKWAIPLVFIHKGMAVNLCRRLHHRDIVFANGENEHLWKCLQVTMCLEKRSPNEGDSPKRVPQTEVN